MMIVFPASDVPYIYDDLILCVYRSWFLYLTTTHAAKEQNKVSEKRRYKQGKN